MIPRGVDWKTGMARALGPPHRTPQDVDWAWQQTPHPGEHLRRSEPRGWAAWRSSSTSSPRTRWPPGRRPRVRCGGGLRVTHTVGRLSDDPGIDRGEPHPALPLVRLPPPQGIPTADRYRLHALLPPPRTPPRRSSRVPGLSLDVTRTASGPPWPTSAAWWCDPQLRDDRVFKDRGGRPQESREAATRPCSPA
ncbi:hypothetical protein QJS66_03685 [Kocuria rhizophila]|nr:hypothetical protein QJS66_03685 [Kocuria rhizophila]